MFETQKCILYDNSNIHILKMIILFILSLL